MRRESARERGKLDDSLKFKVMEGAKGPTEKWKVKAGD